MLIDYKAIGDTLTTAELNAYASLLANRKILTDEFKLKNGVVNGVYGNYEFDLSNASIVDNGILITDETLSNNITVKLSNATQYATYTLHFTVIRYGDVNILDETTDNIETFDLTVDLITDTTINIPLESLQEYDIILFDSQITIKHDLPEIKGAYVTSLQLTSDKLIIQNGESATLTVTALDLDTLPVANKPIKLYKNGTLLDTLTTDSNGQAITSITASSLAEISLVAKYQGTITSEELVINDANLFDLSVTSNKDIMQTGETATLTATLLGDDTPLAGESISFEVYHNNVLQETLSGTTDSSGVASVGYVGKGTGLLNIKAVHGIIQSEIYSIIDAIVIDRATSSDYNNLFSNMNGITRNINDSTYYLDRSGTSASNKSTASYSLSGGLCVEITLTDITTIYQLRVSLQGDDGAVVRSISNSNITTGTIRFECLQNSTKIYMNDILIVNETENNISSLVFQIRTAANSTDNFNYKNLLIYPI